MLFAMDSNGEGSGRDSTNSFRGKCPQSLEYQVWPIPQSSSWFSSFAAETETQEKAVGCPWLAGCSYLPLELGLGVFPTTPDLHTVLGMAGRGVVVAGGRWRVGVELTESCLPKLCGGRSIFTRPGTLAWKHLFPFKSVRRSCLPRMPKSRDGWGRAGVGLETSNAFSRPLGDLVLTWASEALSQLLPPVRSVRSSHLQLTSQFHSVTPAAIGSGGLGWD